MTQLDSPIVYPLAITTSAKCIFPIEQGIQQALIGEYSQKADVAQAISRIAMCKRVGVLEKDVKHGGESR